MRALTFHGEHTVRYESVADPSIEEPRDAIVRVELSAICGSDMHVYHGRERGLDPGTVMGHEFVGTVVETGPGVGRLDVGTRVMSPFTSSCGTCFFCVRGLTARCSTGQLFGWVERGRGLQGAQAEFVRVPLADTTLVRLPSDITRDEGLLLGDVASTGYFAARQADVEPGGVYAVVGCGPVGLMAVVAAIELGAGAVFAVDAVPERLARAGRFGARPVSYCDDDPVATVQDATEGRGADGVLEAVGNAEAHRMALRLVRPGGTISVVGVHNEAEFAFRPVELYDRNLTYRVGRCPARQVLQQLFPIVRSKKYDLAGILTHRLALADGPSGYALFDEKRDGCVKVALEP